MCFFFFFKCKENILKFLILLSKLFSTFEGIHLLGTWQCQTNVRLLFWHFLKNLIETIYV